MRLRDRVKAKLRWDQRSPAERDQLLEKVTPVMRAAASVAGTARLGMGTLAQLSLTDKASFHDYIKGYERHFAPFRNKPVRLLEIGVGGYSEKAGGRSLVLWSSYFKRGRIAALDIIDKTFLSRGRIKVFQGSQVDEPLLNRIADEYGGFDIIIDDGSHINEHLIESFRILWPRLAPGGIYALEDLETAYRDDYGGGPVGTDGYEASSMQFLRSIIDAVNNRIAPGKTGDLERFGNEILSIHFYEELCIIEKRR